MHTPESWKNMHQVNPLFQLKLPSPFVAAFKFFCLQIIGISDIYRFFYQEKLVFGPLTCTAHSFLFRIRDLKCIFIWVIMKWLETWDLISKSANWWRITKWRWINSCWKTVQQSLIKEWILRDKLDICEFPDFLIKDGMTKWSKKNPDWKWEFCILCYEKIG